MTEREPCFGVDRAQPDGREQQPEQQRERALERRATRDHHRAAEADDVEPEVLGHGGDRRQARERLREEDQHRGAEETADRAEHHARAERAMILAALGEGVEVVGVRGRRRCPRNAHQRARNVAGRDRTGFQGDHGGERCEWREEVGQRHDQRDGHRRREAGNRPEQRAVDRSPQDHQQDAGIGNRRERLGEDVDHLTRRRTRAAAPRAARRRTRNRRAARRPP